MVGFLIHTESPAVAHGSVAPRYVNVPILDMQRGRVANESSPQVDFCGLPPRGTRTSIGGQRADAHGVRVVVVEIFGIRSAIQRAELDECRGL